MTGFGRIFIVVAAAAAPLSTASADEFAWQISGGAHRSDVQGGSGVDTAGIEATYFFRPVDDGRGPLALASFLSRRSRITGVVERIRTQQVVSYSPPFSGSLVSSTFTDETDVFSVRGRKVWEESGWFVGAGGQAYDLTNPQSSSYLIDTDREAFVLFGGKYVGPSTALELRLSASRQDTEATSLPCPPQTFCFAPPMLIESERDTDEAALSVMHVGGRGVLRYAVSGEVLSSDTTFTFSTTQLAQPSGTPPFVPFPGSGVIAVTPVPPAQISGGIAAGFVAGSTALPFGTQNRYTVAGEVFPTARLGLRLGYVSFSDFGALEDRYELGATWFFRRDVAVEFGLARARLDAGTISLDDDQAMLRLTGRL